MTAQTPTYHLTYAQSTDPLCDGAEITQQLAEDIEAALAGVAADIDRLTVVPYVVVATTVSAPTWTFPMSVGSIPWRLPWDTVLADTDNFADFPSGGTPTMDWSATQNPTGVYLGGFGLANYTSSGMNWFSSQFLDLVTVVLVNIANNTEAATTTLPGQLNEQGLVALSGSSTNTQFTGQLGVTFAGVSTDNITGTTNGTFGWFIWMRDFS